MIASPSYEKSSPASPAAYVVGFVLSMLIMKCRLLK